MTRRQRDVLAFVIDFQVKTGFCPTLRDMMTHFHIASPQGVTCHLAALEKKGFILRKPGSARAIYVLRNSDGTPRGGSHAAIT